MLRPVTRTILLIATILGILLPQGSAFLASMGLAKGQLIVICTGDGMRTIRLDDHGNPVETGEESEFCALTHAAQTSMRPVLTEANIRFLFTAGNHPDGALITISAPVSTRLPRAPPMA